MEVLLSLSTTESRLGYEILQKDLILFAVRKKLFVVIVGITVACLRMRSIKGRFDTLAVPCNRCIMCRIAKTNEWTLRLELELEYWKEASFVTLTYDPEYLPEDISLKPKHLQDFMKLFRYYLGKKISFFACGEYGDEGLRPHYHLIIFGWKPELSELQRHGKYFSSDFIRKIWKYGFNTVGICNHDTIQYTVGYVRKKLYGGMAQEKYGFRVRPFMRCSKGLGLSGAKDRLQKINDEYTIVLKGVNRGLPKYFVDKLGIDKEKLKLRHNEKVAEVMIDKDVDMLGATNLLKESYIQKAKNHETLYNLRQVSRRGRSNI